jgi:hypothetical protein
LSHTGSMQCVAGRTSGRVVVPITARRCSFTVHGTGLVAAPMHGTAMGRVHHLDVAHLVSRKHLCRRMTETVAVTRLHPSPTRRHGIDKAGS